MQSLIFWTILVSGLFFVSCGGSDNGESGTAKPVEKVFDPWEGVGSGSLTEEVNDRIRELTFADGMTVSYDGSAEDGTERVCRRQQSSDTWYEVCMPLEDDPYFVLAPNSALVWNPLAYNRFATELVCRFWMDIEDVMEEDCDTAFFEKMGGEGFSCQAKPVSGDKALVCSDHWAVAVNGLDEDTKTVCRVYTESGTGRCLGAPLEGVADASLLLQMQQTDWQGYSSVRDNSGQFAPGDMGQLVAPQDVPPGARLSYASEDENVCTIDGDAVMINAGATAPDTCKIFLTVKASGYADRVLFVELPILQESDAAWADYIRSNNYFYPGEMLAAGAVSSSDPATTENAYQSLDESVCTVDADSGEVTAVAPGECGIRLTAVADGYLDTIIDKKLPVDALSEGQWTIAWADFPTDAVVGVPTATLAAPRLVDGEDAPVDASGIAIVVDSDSCTYAAGVLSFADAGECAVTVTARTTREYAPVEQTFRVTPTEGSFALTWMGYSGGNTTALGLSAPVLSPPSVAPVLDGVAYAYSADGDGCEVDEATGSMTILKAGSCTVTLTATRSGYGDQEESHQITIAKISQGVLDVPTNPYGGVLSLAVGKTISIVEAPYDGEGNPKYSTTDETVCTVDADGTIAAVAVGSCTIQVAWSGDEYYAPTDPQDLRASLPIVADDGDDSNNVAAALTEAAYGATYDLVVGGAPLAVATPPSSGTGQTGAVEYRTSTPDICRVDLSTGAIRGRAAGDCQVQVRYVGSTTVAASDWSEDYIVVVGKGEVPDIANPYGSSPVVRIGGESELRRNLLGSYGPATFIVGSGPCSVDGDGTVTPTEDAAPTNECVIQVAFDTNENYNAKGVADLATLEIIQGSQIVTFSEPYGADPSLMMGATLALVVGSEPVSDQGGAISYQSADTSICTVNSATGEIAPVAVGECVVQVIAAAVLPNYSITRLIDIATVEVEEGILPLDWNPQRWGRVGANLALTAVETGSLSGVTVTYSVSNAGDTGCTFSGTTLAFTGTGVCVVTATASKTHYADWNREHVIRVRPAAITVTPGEFTAGETLQVGDSDPQIPAAHSGLSPSDATAVWRLVRGERDCELVSASTGAVRARAVSFEGGTPECSVQVVASKPNYETVKSAPVSIALSLGEIGDVAIRYGSGVTNFLRTGGGTADMTPPPMDENGVSIRITNITFEGTDSADAAKENVCEVDTQTGRATALEGAEDTDKCVIAFTVAALGYADKTVVVSLPLVSGELVFENTPPELAYGGNLKIGVDTPLVATISPASDDNDVAVTWKYSVEGNCEVDDSDGALTLSEDAAAGDACTVRAVAIADGFGDYIAEGVEMTVDAGTLDFTTAAKPTFVGTLHTGGSLAPTLPNPSADDNSVAVTWENWRVDGDLCPVDATTGVVSAGAEEAVCTIFATAVAPNYDSLELKVADLTVAATGSLGVIIPPVYNGKLTLRAYPIAVVEEPTAESGKNITWRYSAAEGICTVDAQSGTVTLGEGAVIGDICRITVTASASGYTSDSTILELPVHDTFVSLDWPTFLNGGGVGATIDLSGANGPISEPVEADYAISVASGNCTYNSTADTLVFADTDPCVLSVTASKANYIDLTATFSVTADLGSITVAGWGTYNAVKVGAATDAPAIGATTPTGVTKSYDTGSDSPGCTVTSAGAVTGTGAGTNNCQVVLTVSKDYYNDVEHTYTLSVGKGSQGAPPTDHNPYGVNPVLAFGATLGITTALPDGEGAPVYSIHSGDTANCSVANSGTVTPTAAGVGSNCRIRAKYAGNANYLESSVSTIATIGIVKAANPGSSGTLDLYADNVAIGAPISRTGNLPSGGTGAWEFRIRDSATYSGSSSSTACSISGGSVSGTGGSVGSTCHVFARWSGSATVLPSDWFGISGTAGITVIKGSQSAPVTNGNPYGSSPTLAVGAAAKSITNALAVGQGTLVYSVHTSDTTYCSVDSGTGAVTASAAGADEDCRIQAKYRSTADYNDSGVATIATIGITKGTLTVNWRSYAALVVGSSVSAPTITATNASGNEVTVSPTYSDGTNTSNCTVTASTGAVQGDSVGNSCQVDVTVTAAGYNDEEHTYTIEVGAGTIAGLGWSPTQSSGTVGVATTLSPTPTGTADGDTVTYNVVSGDCNFADNTVSTLTFTGVANCVVTASVARSGYATWTSGEHTISVSKGSQSAPPGNHNPYGASPSVAFGDTLRITTALPAGKGAATYSVHNGDTAKCSVATDGTVTPKTGGVDGTCRIRARYAGNANYNRSTLTTIATISITKGTITAVWGSYNDVAVGGTVNPPSITTTPTSGIGRTYSAGQGSTGCTLTVATGAVRGDSAGNGCKVKVTLSATGYNNLEHTYTVTVALGSITGVSWSPSQSTGQVGVNLLLDGVSGNQNGDTVGYSVVRGDCGFGSGSATAKRTLSFTDTADCVVTASVGRSGHATWTSGEHTISVSEGAWTSVSSPAYSTSIVTYGGGTPSLRTNPAADPTPDSWSWSGTAGVCTVNGSGQLTIVGTGDCSVRAVPVKTGYATHAGVTITPILVRPATISGVSWTPAGTGIQGTPLVLPVVAGTQNGDAITYSKVSGTCSLTVATRTLTFSDTTNCVVKATVARDHHNTWNSGDKTITVSGAGSLQDFVFTTNRPAHLHRQSDAGGTARNYRRRSRHRRQLRGGDLGLFRLRHPQRKYPNRRLLRDHHRRQRPRRGHARSFRPSWGHLPNRNHRQCQRPHLGDGNPLHNRRHSQSGAVIGPLRAHLRAL